MDNNTSEPISPGAASEVSVSSDGFTPAQLQKMATWEIEAGRLTREQADAMLNADNALADASTAPPGDEQTLAVVETPGLPPIDLSDPMAMAEHQAYMDVPAEGQPYTFEYSFGQVIDPAFVNEMQGLCRDLALPPWLARHVSKEYGKAEAAYKAGQLTPQSIELQRNKSEFTLRGMWKDQYNAKVQAAQSVVQHLPADKRERVMQIMADSGLGNDPLILSHLATLAQHRSAAHRKKG